MFLFLEQQVVGQAEAGPEWTNSAHITGNHRCEEPLVTWDFFLL